MSYTEEQIEELKKIVFDFNKRISEMNKIYGRKFTMDGHMIGSVGEVFASYHYGIQLYESGHKFYDGYKGEKKIQIKISQRDSVEVKGVPDYLIVLKIKYFNDHIELFEVFNGPGKSALPGKDKNDYRESSLSINKLSKIEVDISERISEVVQINKWQNTNK